MANELEKTAKEVAPTIKNWPPGERPREKLLARGAAALSDAELLAIFLQSGDTRRSAVDLARSLLQQFGGFNELLSADKKTFCSCRGVGEVRYITLQAALELSRRYIAQGLRQQPVFTRVGQVNDYLAGQLAGRRRETFIVLLLDAQHRLLDSVELFHGSVDSASVHPREVVQLALQYNAVAIIVAHNHPSGVAEPSHADIAITARLEAALGLVDIALLDHFIVGRGVVTSLASRGLLKQ